MVRAITPSTRRARSLRRQQTDAEARLWQYLRNRVSGYKFKRQLPIGRYIADFACWELKLVIELDGSQHIDSQTDAQRDAIFNASGWSVVRFGNLTDTETGLETIAAIAEGRMTQSSHDRDFHFKPSPSPDPSGHPLSQGRGGKQGAGVDFMARAIALAWGQMGRTWPNPAVGCVIVRDGQIIAEGATGDGGRPHAEEVALDLAGDQARGAVAYVTLEPCGQRSTGCASCSERLVAAGIGRVVYACDDPSAYASHVGPQRLRAAGIEVEGGLMAPEGARLIDGWVYFLQTGLPLIEESDTPEGFDAEFSGPAEALKDWADKGYRRLFVRPGSDEAQALEARGYLARKSES